MNRVLYNTSLTLLLSLFLLFSKSSKGQQFLTTIDGWNAYVHVPANYSSSPATKYPLILFIPGIGEVGTNASKLLKYGPNYFVSLGDNMTFNINGKVVTPIVISIQPASAWPGAPTLNQKLDSIIKRWRIDTMRMHGTGLSMGGWAWQNYVDGYNPAFTGRLASIVPMSAPEPDNTIDNMRLFAQAGGKWWGFEGTNDYRKMDMVRDTMNKYVPGSARYYQYVGGHCCWNTWYDPSWKDTDGETIYSWMLKQQKTTVALANQAPVANAGSDITITSPLSTINLNGTGNDPDGSIASYVWSKISGPGSVNISSSISAATSVSALVPGVYTFQLKVTDNNGAVATDSIQVVVNAPASSCGCDHILQPAADGGIYFTNGNGMTVLPGEKVCIQGGYYPYISLIGLVGTASQPITITNCGGQVICGSGPTYCYRILNSRFFKFTGTGAPGITYGFKAYWSGGTTAAGMSVRDSTSDYEIDHLETQNSQNGFLCKIDPADCTPASWSTGWTIKNVSIHDNYVHKTVGEGMYIVNTGVTQTVKDCNNQTITIEPVKMSGLKLYNNIIDSTGWDGIQVAATTNAEIYKNTVTNYGIQNLGSQQAGIILGGKSNGSVHDNYIADGTGEGLEIFGYGNVNIYNNILANTGWDGTAAKQDAIAVDDRPQPNNQYTGLQVYINNNTIVNAARNAIHLFNSYNTMAQGNKIYNNLLVKPNNTSIYDNPYTNIDGNTNVDTLNNVKISVIANAFFVNANANNFHLQLNSPAIDKGLNTASYSVTADYDGVSRPQGSAFDAGAFEYNFGTPPQNIPPVADAGGDKTITLPTNSVSFAGSGSDADGSVSSYAWSKVSGPSATITSAASATTSVTSLVQGVYLFELKVTDNQGAVARDTVKVTVNAAGNIPPVADAGTDKTITLPINSVSLSGSGSDADGSVSSYAWSKVSGPSATITSAASATTPITSLVQGVYLFELKVTDNGGATARDTVKVTVNAAGNIPPVSNAGADKTITLPTNSVSLSGSGSDADGSISSYAWSKVSGSSATITSAASAITSITSLVQGVYLFELKITDNGGATARDTVKVTVNAAGNIPPVSNAGADKTITLPTNSVSLSGSGSDADGSISSYAWSKVSGPSATITSAASAITSITSLVQGVYLFELKVTDNGGATARDTVKVTVNAAGNIPPVSNAGADKTITLPTNSVSLSGSGSDADGSISNYLWSKISGPSATITSAASATTSVTSLVQGVYLFELKVTDNQGAIARDTVKVTVNAAGNIPPVADAGADKTITLPTNSVSLSGSGSDADGSISNYLWTKISGPSATITSAASATTSITSLVQGVYLFELKVTDNQGAIARDTVKVTVNVAANIPPVANAGADKTITLPVSIASLTGNGTDADGTVTNYLWTKISGPAVNNIINPASPVTDVSGLVVGNYLFELKVTDNKGATGKDTVKVTVKNTVNVPPIVNAGPDQTITLPKDSTILSGNGMDADGSIKSFYWKQISGPSISTITAADSAVSNVKNLIGGTYLYELLVTDNSGATAKDTLSVVVAVPRLAQTINRLKIYPNPVIDIATLEITTEKSNLPLLVIITDLQGRVVYKNQIYSTQNVTTNKIDMSNLIKGIYAVTVYFSNNEKQTIKVFRSN